MNFKLTSTAAKRGLISGLLAREEEEVVVEVEEEVEEEEEVVSAQWT